MTFQLYVMYNKHKTEIVSICMVVVHMWLMSEFQWNFYCWKCVKCWMNSVAVHVWVSNRPTCSSCKVQTIHTIFFHRHLIIQVLVTKCTSRRCITLFWNTFWYSWYFMKYKHKCLMTVDIWVHGMFHWNVDILQSGCISSCPRRSHS
jgi:hypothetical protein